jgi:glycosyltransferase involved in cell wall biosynthesis
MLFKYFMKIIHIVEPFASGVAVFVRSLTEAMPDDLHIVVHGERKELISAAEVKKNFPRQNVRFIKWRSAQRSIDPVRDLLALSELYTILRRLKKKNLVDAVHLHSSKSGILGRAACRMAGINNFIYTPNGASFLSARNKLVRFIYKRLEKLGYCFGGKVVCCSASELAEYVKLGIGAAYINNSINISEDPEKQSRKTGDHFRIVTSGRIENQKNPELFNSIAAYFKDMGQVEFAWIGEGEGKKFLTSENIIVTGWRSSKEVNEEVAGADLYLSTSHYEGLSFGVLEALALRKPVLLSNCTGNRDIVKKGINGGLFNSADDAIVKILQYYNNREMLQVMGNYSGEICRTEFDIKQNFSKYRDLYAGSKTEPANGEKWSFG